MPERSIIPCPVCDATGYSVVYQPLNEVNDPKLLYGTASGLRDTQQLVRCDSCTLIYENPRFSEAEVIDGYRQAKGGAHDSQFDLRASSFEKTLRSLKDYLPEAPAKILDVGTAGGAFLEASTQLGYQPFGVEPSDDLVKRAQDRGLNVQQGVIEQSPFGETRFDVVTLWDVLEHLCEPRRTLGAVIDVLKEDGVILINVPEIETALGRPFGRKMWWIQSVHLLYFNEKSMRTLLESLGLKLIVRRRFWQSLELGHLVQMAGRLGVPGAKAFAGLLPRVIFSIPVKYYAAQMTYVARKA